MLKRQRPATPPPVSLDFAVCFPDRPVRPLPHSAELSNKRRRVHDSTFGDQPRQEESDGEEDCVDDDPSCLSPPSRADMDYKRSNCLLHELHVLHQHRLMFSPSDHPSSTYGPPSPSICTHFCFQGNADATNIPSRSSFDKLPIPQPSSPAHSAPHARTGQPYSDQAVLHEAQSVWERYEGTNRLLGSLFLSRRRELQEDSYSSATHDATER
ncbi:hypothetical protein J3A83DRAFT_4537689 [Scleroderma citrinum]